MTAHTSDMSTGLHASCPPTHLCKLREAAAGLSRRCDENFWVSLSSMSVLVIYMVPCDCCVVVFKLNLTSELRLVMPQVVRNWFALCIRGFNSTNVGF